jgi:hypothetical protein
MTATRVVEDFIIVEANLISWNKAIRSLWKGWASPET